MCGIVGYMSREVPVDREVIDVMTSRMRHRGPDDSGTWHNASVAFGHRRLSILDLSEAGHQPMSSPGGRFIIVFNGEIYNHQELRKKLIAEGLVWDWKGYSDTEVLLAGIYHWGMLVTLKRLNGMFSLAVWDNERQLLSLARDRAGEKPLYYGCVGRSFLFGSELKPLTEHPEWEGEVDRDVLSLYMRHGYVPDPWSIYKGIFKLPPAHYLEISLDDVSLYTIKAYWSFNDIVTQVRYTSGAVQLTDQLENVLRRAVAIRMVSDVPLGAFLSGGIDSSTIVALMQSQSAIPVRTFTIGFDVPGYNEAESAKAIATHLGTEHTELYLRPQDALDVVPLLPEIWDEPFADASQLPTLLLSRMTRSHVTVALSGDAGDELFCGYNRYGQGYSMYKHLGRFPASLRQTLSAFLQGLNPRTIDRVLKVLPTKFQYPALGDRLVKLGVVLEKVGDTAFYKALVSQFQDPDLLVHSAREKETLLSRSSEWPYFNDFRECMMYLDTQTYLPGDILTKVDRATMAVSLEARVPFLDPEVIEFAWRLPIAMKFHNGETKWLLRQVLERYVPRALFERPKMGFGVPIEHWLGSDLREWADELLNPQRLRDEGYLNVEVVSQLWSEHKSGKRRWHYQIWTILMFQSWLEQTKKNAHKVATC